jgi:ABC-type phosphate transport system substrate-binding protein
MPVGRRFNRRSLRGDGAGGPNIDEEISMRLSKFHLLAHASLSAIAAAASLSATPARAIPTPINGVGGPALTSVLLRALFDCYSNAAVLPAGCAAPEQPPGTYVFNYGTVGLGLVEAAWLTQDRPGSGTFENIAFVASEEVLHPRKADWYNYGHTGLINIATSGLDNPRTLFDEASLPPNSCIPPLWGMGDASGHPCHNSPRLANGRPIQFPFAVTSVGVVYDPIYKWLRRPNGTLRQFLYNNTTTGTINLRAATFCKIWAGQITTWDHPELSAANGGTPLWPDPADPDAGTPGYNDGREIVLVHRDDDSITTALFTRSLRAICGTTNDGRNAGTQFNLLGSPPAVWPAGSGDYFASGGFDVRFPGSPSASIQSGSLECRGNIPFGTVGREEAWDAPNYIFYATNDNSEWTFAGGTYLRARGDAGVASCVNVPEPQIPGGVSIGGRIGYATPLFFGPSAVTPPQSDYNLLAFDLENRDFSFRRRTERSVLEAARQAVVAPPAGSPRLEPVNWVASPSGVLPNGDVNPIADPPGFDSYSIIGTTNFRLYTCYAQNDVREGLAKPAAGGPTDPRGFLNWLYANEQSQRDILELQGFVPLPGALRNAIISSFLLGSGSANLYIRTGPSGTLCSVGAQW